MEESTRSKGSDEKPAKRSKWEEPAEPSPSVTPSPIQAMMPMHHGMMHGMLPGMITGLMPAFGMASATASVTYSTKPELTEEELLVRTLEVENLPANVNSQELMEYFNGAVLAVTGNTIQQATARLAPTFDAKVDSSERSAMLFFRTIVGASVGFKLNGIEYKAHKLKILRSSGFNIPEGEEDPAIKLEFKGLTILDLIGPPPSQVTIEDKGQPKLSIFGIPPDLTEPVVRDLLEQFGTLRMLNLIRDLTTGYLKGYGFLEFDDEDDGDRAVEGLSGFICGVSAIKITRLGQTQKVNAQEERSANFFQNMGTMDSMTAKIAGNHVLAMQLRKNRECGLKHSRVVQMLNAVYQEDLMDPSDFSEIKEEIRLHGARFGAITEVNIPKPSRDGLEVDGLGKVFVVFQDVTSARKFQADVNGRKFENRVVCAAFYPYDRYTEKKYTLT